MPDIQTMTDAAFGAAHFMASMLAAVAILGGAGFAGAWMIARGTPCNPYGHDACACGCGTDCEELPGG